MKILNFFIIFFLVLNIGCSANSLEIKNLASIDNEIITNIDLLKEIQIREVLENRKINKSDHFFVLQQMINDKIKKLEVVFSKVNVSEKIINSQYASLKNNKLKEKKISQELEKLIILKIEDTYKWNKLINLKYGSKLAINIDEINEIMKSKKIPEDKRDKIVEIEKNKKLNTFSKTHFNKIKKKYLIKKY